jgi:anthranilate synthase component 2
LRLLVIDNYDSFTYNLVDYFARLGIVADAYRNDAITVNEAMQYDRIVLSPGPGLPHNAGIMPALITAAAGNKPLLGVCLGHQGLCEHFGGRLQNVELVCHGNQTATQIIAEDPLFTNLPSPFITGHYHSWVVDRQVVGNGMVVTAVNDRGWVMAVKHETMNIRGVQFHPESVLTPNGLTLLKNWVTHC